MLNNKSELTNWAQNTKHKNTNWHQNLSQKSSKNPIFVVRKWAPQEVVLFLTLEVVPKLTLERPKSGTKTNSPQSASGLDGFFWCESLLPHEKGSGKLCLSSRTPAINQRPVWAQSREPIRCRNTCTAGQLATMWLMSRRHACHQD